MDKISKDKIKKLKSEQKYDEIFAEFGSKVYVKNTPKKIKKAELTKFKKERRYEDIFNKYGEEEYNKILVKAMYEEIKEIGGFRKAFLWRLKRIALRGASLSLATAASFSTLLPVLNSKTYEDNAIEYAAEIEAYNEKIDDYASHVNSMNLSDIQIFMKVMDDMWKGIQGYKEPEKSIEGYSELNLAMENGYGDCVNMASDVARKLQEINPDYNARTIIVYNDSAYKIADIHRNVIQDNETVMEEKKEQAESLGKLDIAKMIGNHMVTLVDLNDENITLVLDPTNPGIGVYRDGTIIMLNTAKKDLIQYNPKEITTTLFYRGGADAAIISTKEFIESFTDSPVSLEELIDKYGLEAQNQALNQVRTLEKTNQAINAIEPKEENDFDKRIKVDISQLNNNRNKDSKEEIKNKSYEQEDNERF